MCSIEVIKSIHGGKVLSVNIFLYILNKNYKRKRDDRNVFYWTCSTKCGAKICTVETSNGEHEIDEFSTFSEDQHSHAADPIAIEAKKIKENIKQQALTSNVEKPIHGLF
ncbi:unnamed protein product [Macrosiphum euphorbiae]|uniref:FLYWCH-type domain-containing protein n=1 Tax=Macrosiphum euphorbiae TaxID=13131 RepID=A0AAV0Y2K7_9HEMI|nr:unnamed protein product [Macrosiphum euphorbiae]